MKLSLRSEHALLSLIHLARHSDGKDSSLEALAASQQIPSEPLAEILSVLEHAGYLKQAAGGFCLARDAEQISVAEVIRLFDGALAPLEPVSSKGYAPAPMDKEEKLAGLFGNIQEQISARLEDTMISELA